MTCRKVVTLALALAMLLVSRVDAADQYKEPDLKSDIFGGSLTVDSALCRRAASSLALLCRNGLSYNPPFAGYMRAARALGIALRIDPDNADAKTLNNELANGTLPPANPAWPKNAALADVRALAVASAGSKAMPDQVLAAYLYDVMMYYGLTADDIKQKSRLMQARIITNWVWADMPEMAMNRPPGIRGGASEMPSVSQGSMRQAEEPPPAVRQLSKIRGLVVMRAPDGLYHGKVIEIMAVAGVDKPGMNRIRFIGQVGREMSISMDEAIRVVRLRHPGGERACLEISFDDKYSQKDGGSAGTAFTVLLLSALKEFEIDENIALTGDITVDQKVRPVGEVGSKVHGAALDHVSTVGIPADCVGQMEDAILTDGPSALWEIQVFSMNTLDDAIALARVDRDPKLTQAMSMFAALKESSGTAPVESLKDPVPAAKLAKILELAPNHVSARYLQQLATGKGPTHLSLAGSIDRAIGALGPLRLGLATNGHLADPVADNSTANARKNLARVKAMSDPAAAPLFTALEQYCAAYGRLAAADSRTFGAARVRLQQDANNRAAAVRQSLETIVTDRDAIDKLLHQ